MLPNSYHFIPFHTISYLFIPFHTFSDCTACNLKWYGQILVAAGWLPQIWDSPEGRRSGFPTPNPWNAWKTTEFNENLWNSRKMMKSHENQSNSLEFYEIEWNSFTFNEFNQNQSHSIRIDGRCRNSINNSENELKLIYLNTPVLERSAAKAIACKTISILISIRLCVPPRRSCAGACGMILDAARAGCRVSVLPRIGVVAGLCSPTCKF